MVADASHVQWMPKVTPIDSLDFVIIKLYVAGHKCIVTQMERKSIAKITCCLINVLIVAYDATKAS